MQRDDVDLREMFAQSRAEDRQQLPPFATLTTADAPRRERGMLGRRAATLLAAGLVIASAYVALRQRPTTGRSREGANVLGFDLGSTHWESPTDFLLATPGDSLLRTLPSLRYSGAKLLEAPSPSPQPDRTSPNRDTGRSNS